MTNKKHEPSSQVNPAIDSAAAEHILNGDNGKTLIKCCTAIGGFTVFCLSTLAFYAIGNDYDVTLTLFPPKLDMTKAA